MQSMSFDIYCSTPHLYGAFAGEDGHQLARALGYSSYDDACDIERWMSAYSLRNGLSVTVNLVSPLDPKAVEAHRRYSMKDFAEARDNPISIPSRVQSYAIAMQGDLKAGETVMAMTRNIKDTEPNYRQNYIRSWGRRNDVEIWKYPNEDRSYNRHKGAAHICGSGFKVYEAQFKGADDLPNGIGQLEERQGN